MRDYNILERPVANHTLPVTVYLKVSLQQLIDVDEKNQIVYVNAWLDYTWNDYKLRWDREEYGNISDVRFPAGRIWKPDVSQLLFILNNLARFMNLRSGPGIFYDSGRKLDRA